MIDIGAGSGRDAAWLDGLGHRVLAVEPTKAMRDRAQTLHPNPGIEWLDDSLPDLPIVRARGEQFDLIYLSAVWVHFDPHQRNSGMSTLAKLAGPDCVFAMTISHGPVPTGRRMFEVPDEETVALAETCGFTALMTRTGPALGRRNQLEGVSFAQMVFRARIERA